MPDLAAAQEISAFAARLRLGDVPRPVLERAKLHILDALGLAFASTVQEFGRTVSRLLQRWRPPGRLRKHLRGRAR